ncbi:MAG: hypothetical protein U0822_08615 [Anaerolineae bacterium]
MTRMRLLLCVMLAACGLTLGAMTSLPAHADGNAIPERYCPLTNPPAKWPPIPGVHRHPSPCPPLDPPIAIE